MKNHNNYAQSGQQFGIGDLPEFVGFIAGGCRKFVATNFLFLSIPKTVEQMTTVITEKAIGF